ncbi:MAG: hypothetical protein GY765_39975 [bacterium]|nr:hypothetical protein [bacterium]
MGMFPWDDLFYHVRGKAKKVGDLYNQYIHQRDTIGTQGDHLRNRIGDLQSITAYTKALLLNASIGKMTDDDYHQFLSNNELNKPMAPKQSMVIQIYQGIAELVGFMKFGQTLFRFGKLIKQSYFTEPVDEAAEVAEEDISEMISDAAAEAVEEAGVDEAGDIASSAIVDAAADAGVEAGSEAGLEAVGEAVVESTMSAVSVACAAGGIFAAIGIDALLGAINGAVEAKELNDQIDKLDAGLSKVTAFLGRINGDISKCEASILAQINQFKKVVAVLTKIQAATFDYDYPSEIAYLPQWKVAIQKAGRQYFYLSKVRNDFHEYLHNWNTDNPDTPFNKRCYKMWRTMESTQRPEPLTKKQALGFIDYVATVSDEMKKYA